MWETFCEDNIKSHDKKRYRETNKVMSVQREENIEQGDPQSFNPDDGR